MEIVKAGYNYRHSSSFRINRPNGSGDYLLLIIRTEAFIVLCGERLTVPQNSAVIFKKGTPQFYGGVQDKFINDWIHFELGAEEEATFFTLGIPLDTVIPLYQTNELSGFVKSIVFERHSQNVHKQATIKHYFDLLLLKLSEKIHTRSANQVHPYYSQFYKLRSSIQLDPQSDWNIDDICKKMMLSRSYIQHLYKLFFGTTITSDVQSGRMEYAKYLLSATDMPITGISHACGYENDVHFMRIFKKTTGITPSAFRSEFRTSR